MKKELHEVRKLNRDKWSEQGQILLQEIDNIKSQNQELQSKLDQLGSVRFHIVKSKTTVGGSDTEQFYAPGARKGMLAIAQISSVGASPVYVVAASCEQDNISIKFSGNPSSDHKVTYAIFH